MVHDDQRHFLVNSTASRLIRLVDTRPFPSRSLRALAHDKRRQPDSGRPTQHQDFVLKRARALRSGSRRVETAQKQANRLMPVL